MDDTQFIIVTYKDFFVIIKLIAVVFRCSHREMCCVI